MTLVGWIAVAIFAGVYVLIATERIHRVAAALGGAGLVLGLGILSSEDAFYSLETGIDWDVIFLLLGMMLVVGVIRRTGVFEYMAIRSAKLAHGKPFRVMVLLILVTAVASALLDNVTTLLLIAPVTLLVCDRLGLMPVPFLIAEALASNIGGAATLVGDPPNIIIASRAGLSFVDFLVHMLPLVVILMASFILLARFMFRKALTADPARAEMLHALDEREAITDPRLLWRSGLVLAAIIAGFLLERQTGVAPSVVALVGAGIMLLLSPLRAQDLVADVEWETLLFFCGLFILVGALVHVGALEMIAEQLAGATGSALVPTMLVVLVMSAVLSAVVDNIPYVTAMTPVVASLIASNPELGEQGALWWVLAAGADFGGNATLVGASANVVVVGIAARNGIKISFGTWLRYGLPTAALTIALTVPYMLLRYG
ncbi:MAG: ArsB/NhaD family transporter [Candidatus Nanopelagicales bacterium]|nr:ArsB/NhaD family transporter [Candidatus Nanopelagicales bacterium]MDZ4248896.1 ArsB/NhaD family transporter [Candidatus Nanopelagicales bacterium]MDZ7578872.1 ArsB/NhaD family transporter [Candidatus Nanopelagicales bacterium]